MNTRNELEKIVLERAMKDEDFRKQLLANPREILEQVSGMKIPSGFKVNVVEEDPNTYYLVLPHSGALPADSDELTESELIQVSGGYVRGPDPDPTQNCTNGIYGC